MAYNLNIKIRNCRNNWQYSPERNRSRRGGGEQN